MMFDNSKQKSKKIKRIVGYLSAAILTLGASAGIGVAAYETYRTMNVSNDFDRGRSVQVDLKLTNASGNLMQDRQNETELLQESSQSLIQILENLGLTNINVSYGFAFKETTDAVGNDANTDNQNPFPKDNNIRYERYGVLTASFENSPSALGLNDVNNTVNNLFNEAQIAKKIEKSNRLQLEAVSNSYPGIIARTERFPSNFGLQYNSTDQAIIGTKDWLVNDKTNYTGEIKPYEDLEHNIDSTFVAVESTNTYNNGIFVAEENAIKVLEKEEADSNQPSAIEGEEAPPPATIRDKHQTETTWILWNDKQGLINYLNKLIVLWYFNLYSNINLAELPDTTLLTKDNFESVLFDTQDFNYENYVYSELRDQINVYINSLSTIEKQFMAFMGVGIGGQFNNVPWYPVLIDDNTLIPIIYEFYNSSTWSTPPTIDNLNDVPSSVRNGWGFLESSDKYANSTVDTLIADYLVGMIDYNNYATYFKNPNKLPDDWKTTDPIDPFYVKSINLSNSNYSADQYANVLKNDLYRFPIFVNNRSIIVENWTNFNRELTILNQEYVDKNVPGLTETERNAFLVAFNQKCKDVAIPFLKASTMFGYQNYSKPKIDNSFTGLPPLSILLIIISVIIFLVGVFVSIRYRVPGFIAFLISSLTFVLSLILYNVFNFTFSFFSFISIIVGVLLSFITPFFFLTNFKKELKDESTISGAIIKSIKKYWRMSLDTHVILILSSLAFLFFGEINNINFGAMLIVSVFLSFILSGIIFFILILYFFITLDFNHEKYFMSKKQYQNLKNMTVNNKASNKFIIFINSWTNNVNYFSKYNFMFLGIIVAIAIAGVVVLSLFGPLSSIDFTSSNIVTVNNFDTIGLSTNQITQIMGINSLNSYVYDNQLIIYTTNNLLPNQIITTISNANISLSLQQALLNNVSASILSSELALRLVYNALECIGIAIGFAAIWSLLSLNIVSVLPIALTQACSVMIFVGLIGITRMPFDLNGISIIILLFMLTTMMSVSCISSIKTSWNRKIMIDKIHLKKLINQIVAKINKNFLAILFIVLAISILSLALASPTLIFTFVALSACIILLIFLNNRLLIMLWYYMNLFRDIFTKELTTLEKSNFTFNYDMVDEQKIKGLNW